MQIHIVEDYEALSKKAADIVARVVRSKTTAVLGLATGSTPIGLYQELIKLYQRGELDFSGVTTFNLDEYVGLTPSHPQSYHMFMQTNFFSQVNVSPEKKHIPRGDLLDAEDVCKDYEQAIKVAGGIDIQILGIGSNGHIGFNEPGTDPSQGTKIIRLAESTRQANARFFEDIDAVPKQAVTMGIRTIMQNSKQILLLATGEKKAEAIHRLTYGKISSDMPASYLQLHPGVTVIVDQAAAARM